VRRSWKNVFDRLGKLWNFLSEKVWEPRKKHKRQAAVTREIQTILPW